MKKFLGGVKKNIFYISLITGMAVLVTVLGLYNAKTNSKEKNIVIGQNTPYGDTSASKKETKETKETQETKETLSGKDKNTGDKEDKKAVAEDNTQDITEADCTEQNTEETISNGEPALSYDPNESIDWPLAGNVIIPYSMDTTVYFETLNEYKCSPAMVIEAMAGDEVKAVYESEVVEVSSNSELGNYVKLDMGSGYTVTLGQLQDVKAALGERLKAGDVVGTVGEPSRFYSKEGTNLYFAIEKDGNPVDPMLLIQ